MIAQQVPSASARLAVSIWGDAGLTMLALHPGVADSRVWQWCAPAWNEAGRRVVAYDRRGFGATETEPEPHDDLADLRTVTAATNAAPAVIVGNSMGGGLALDLALAHPEEVEALVLIAPSPRGYDYATWLESEAEAAQDALVAAAEEAGDVDLVNRLEVRYWLDGTEQPEGRVGGEARELLLEMNGRALRAGPIGAAADHPPVWDRLAQIRAPTLVVSGEHDLPGVLRQCDELAAAIPEAERTTIADAAHCPQLDQPAALSAVVIDFVGSLPAA